MNSELIKRVSRAMAKADGMDPDAIINGSPDAFAETADQFSGNHAPDVYIQGPAWHQYRRSARLYIAAIQVVLDEQ